jgi:hypothetical protein
MEKAKILTYYNRFPYAVDAIFYFMFGNKDFDNIVHNALRGAHGQDAQIIDYPLLSEFMCRHGDNWDDDNLLEHLEDINDFVANLHTFGGKVSDYY